MISDFSNLTIHQPWFFQKPPLVDRLEVKTAPPAVNVRRAKASAPLAFVEADDKAAAKAAVRLNQPAWSSKYIIYDI